MRLSKLWQSDEKQCLKADYSKYFEIGHEGIRLPICEELSKAVAGKKEELVRFYEYFSYQLEPQFQWQPDHLAMQMEFLSFLIEGQWSLQHEAQHQSYLLAQRDFCERHLLSWVPSLVEQAKESLNDHFFVDALSACQNFLQHDYRWLQSQVKQLEIA